MRKLRGCVSGRLVEVTTRTIQGRYLLSPSPEGNATIRGVLGRGQRHTGMKICAYAFLSNHSHMLLLPESTKQLSSFMQFVNGNVARKVGRLHNWTDKFWSRRYQHIVVSDEEEAQISRLFYMLSQGSKENLVIRPSDWPGVHCASELLRGYSEVRGVWRDLTAENRARRSGKVLDPKDFLVEETIHLWPLPPWELLSRLERCGRVAEIVDRIERETRLRHREARSKPLGPDVIRSQDPLERPKEIDSSPAPTFHAATAQVRRELREELREFVSAYREAAERLKQGDKEAIFPAGCFPPGLPYVPEIRAGPD